jgi:urocanate hydratase
VPSATTIRCLASWNERRAVVWISKQRGGGPGLGRSIQPGVSAYLVGKDTRCSIVRWALRGAPLTGGWDVLCAPGRAPTCVKRQAEPAW